jgi:hypothetical protein
MKVALPDGTKRFTQIKEQRKLEKELKKARKSGDKAGIAKIANEATKVKEIK